MAEEFSEPGADGRKGSTHVPVLLTGRQAVCYGLLLAVSTVTALLTGDLVMRLIVGGLLLAVGLLNGWHFTANHADLVWGRMWISGNGGRVPADRRSWLRLRFDRGANSEEVRGDFIRWCKAELSSHHQLSIDDIVVDAWDGAQYFFHDRHENQIAMALLEQVR